MSGPINDGGPAFPFEVTRDRDYVHHGMSLRDYFAAAALQGRIACDEQIGFSDSAVEAYGYADAMLKARAEK